MPPPRKKVRREAATAAPEPEPSEFSEGSIKYIRMKNFMTYKDFSFRPGPGFNVVVGPNGSGKSSIVSAITLGLGGDVSTLRRQQNVADFVNTESEEDEAEITVFLWKGPTQNDMYKIKCTLAKSSSSTSFSLDGEPVSKKTVVALARSLQIQTNNLCQFLPQDVVREFPELPPTKVFQSTVRAVGDQDTLDLHKDLQEEQQRCIDLRKTVETKENTLKDMKRKFDATKDVRDTIEKMKKLEADVKLNKLNLQYMDVKKLITDTKTLTKKAANEEKELNLARKLHADLDKDMIIYVEERKSLETLKQNSLRIAEAAKKAVTNTPANHLNSKIEDLTREIELCDEKALDQQRRLSEQTKEKERLKTLLSKVDVRAMEERKLHWQQEFNKWDGVTQRHKNAVVDLTRALALSDRKVQHYDGEISQLENVENKRLGILRRLNQDAFNGALWLRNNRDKFEAPVHLPMMVTLSLQDPSYKVYAQKLIGRQDLEAFVCESSRDMNKLLSCLRDSQKLKKINAVHSPPQARGEYPSPRVPQQVGNDFVDYVIDMMECPDAVKAFLCKKKQLHNVPVFSPDADSEAVCKQYKRVFIDKKLFVTNTGRYSKMARISVENCEHDSCPHFTDDHDSVLVEQKREQKKEELQKQNEWRRQLFEENQSKMVAEKHLEETRAKRTGVQGELDEVISLKRNLALCENRLASVSSSKDSAKQKERFIAERKAAVAELGKELEKVAASIEQSSEAFVEARKISLSLTQLKVRNKKRCEDFGEAERKKEIAESDLQATRAKLEQERRNLGVEFGKLKWEPGTKKEVPKKLQKQFDAHCPATRMETIAQIQLLQDDITSLPSYSEGVKREAEELGDKVDKSERDLERLSEDLSVLEESVQTKDKALTERVEELVGKIDARFSDLMSALGNTGSVALDKGREGQNAEFNKYGLDIMVGFRDQAASSSSSSVRRLAANVQSGGEKSVTTALYMMALQELTRVPFRCVDEINQGMDEENERLVWKLLLNTATKYSAQYFYLAPKFPRHLEFSENMTVIICFNGTCKCVRKESKANRWDCAALLRRVNRLKVQK